MFDLTRKYLDRAALLAHKPVWPLPAIDDQPPVLLAFDPDDPGIDLAYERVFEPGNPMVRSVGNGQQYFLPAYMPVFAVHDGVIVYASKHSDGYAVVVDHRNGWMTYYSKLEHMFMSPTTRRPPRSAATIKAGDSLGYVGMHEPGTALRTLHFELWKQDKDGNGYTSIDPIRHMRYWLVLSSFNNRNKKPMPVAAQPAA